MPGRGFRSVSLAACCAGGAGVLFAAAMIRGAVFAFHAAVFLMIFMFLLYGYLQIVIRHIRVMRTHNASAVEGEEFFVNVAIANFAYLPIFCLEVQDVFAPGRTLAIGRTIRESILPRSVYEYTANTFIMRKMGTYQVGPMELVVTDPFGIFTVRRTIPHLTDLTVYPAVRVPERLRLMNVPLIKRIGEEIAAEPGYASDFRGQREYRREDPRKMIHWRATARHRRLIVKEFDENAVTDVAVFTDHRRIALRGTGSLSSHELALNAAASVIAAAQQRFHRFGVVFVGHRAEQGPAFGTGVGHLHLMLQAMVSLGRPGNYSDFCAEVETHLASLRRNTTMVVIASQTATDLARLEALVRAGTGRGVFACVILIDDRSFLKIYPEQADLERTAPAFIAARQRLEAAGASVYTLGKGDVPAERLDAGARYHAGRPDRGPTAADVRI